MAGLVGFWIVGFIALYLISALILSFFGKRKWSYKAVTVSALVALTVGTVLSGYGMVDGEAPQYSNILKLNFVPFLAVLAINFLRVKRKLDKRALELAAELERQEDS